MKRLAYLFLALLCVSNTAWAMAEAPASAQELVQKQTDLMLSTFKAQREQITKDPQLLYRLVDEIVLPHFDFEKMSSWVIGKHWRSATDEQKTRFVQEFRSLLVRTYAVALYEYTDQQVVYLPSRSDPAARETTVKTEVRQSGGAPPISINYDLYFKDNAWKVYDVTIEGTSLVTNYRSNYASEIRQHGLDSLIAKLAARNQQSVKTSTSE
ncbi:MAG: ABC transporter substrate-binding protein [Gammaproteobacteria bacterium]|nr:ABC transporter substrate-binding protein [Gammaproteobacteria bacterium]